MSVWIKPSVFSKMTINIWISSIPLTCFSASSWSKGTYNYMCILYNGISYSSVETAQLDAKKLMCMASAFFRSSHDTMIRAKKISGIFFSLLLLNTKRPRRNSHCNVYCPVIKLKISVEIMWRSPWYHFSYTALVCIVLTSWDQRQQCNIVSVSNVTITTYCRHDELGKEYDTKKNDAKVLTQFPQNQFWLQFKSEILIYVLGLPNSASITTHQVYCDSILYFDTS